MIPKAFAIIIDLAVALGVKKICELPGCWERDIDSHWWVAVNGHKEPMACSKSDEPIPPCTAYVQFNGWPAGFFDLNGGIIVAAGPISEKVFIKDVKSAIRRVRELPKVTA